MVEGTSNVTMPFFICYILYWQSLLKIKSSVEQLSTDNANWYIDSAFALSGSVRDENNVF